MMLFSLPFDAKEGFEIRSNSSHFKRKRKPSVFWLLAGPLIGGLLTYSWGLALLKRYAHSYQLDRETAYAAAVAPQLLRPKKTVRFDLDSSWDKDTDDGIDKTDPEAHFLQYHLNDEDRYERHKSPDDGDCEAMHSWQEASFPICNSIHEMDFFNKFRPDGDVVHITNGGFNDLYQYTERFLNGTNDEAVSQSLAVKILKWEKPYSELKFGVVRQDAVTLERLTKSQYIYSIYGYCGFYIVVPFFTEGRLADALSEWKHGERKLSPMTRLKYAVDIAAGLRELHDIDGDGVPSATHGDLKEHQYLFGKDGRLLLGDFNKGQFITKSSTSGKSCTYKPPSRGYNDKLFRSPEEYAHVEQTAATDVYALGSLFYYLLTGERAWEGYSDKKERKKTQGWIVGGKKPHISSKFYRSEDPIDKALLQAYDMSTVFDPKKRATAKEVADYLNRIMEKLSRSK